MAVPSQNTKKHRSITLIKTMGKYYKWRSSIVFAINRYTDLGPVSWFYMDTTLRGR